MSGKLLFLVIIAICTGSFSSFSQSGQPSGKKNKIDSLLAVLKTSREDTNKIKTLCELSWKLINKGDYEKTKQYALEALHLSEKLNFKVGSARAYNIIGIACKRLGNYPEALKNYFASLRINEELKEPQNIAAGFNNIGIIYELQGNYEEALKNHFASLKIKEQAGDKTGIATSHNNIGLVYFDLGEKTKGNAVRLDSLLKKALQHHNAALAIRKEIKDKNGIAMSFNNLGNVYMLQGINASDKKSRDTLLTRALKSHFASLKTKEDAGNKQGIASSWINIGLIYSKQGNYKKAKEFMNKALNLAKEIGEKDEIKDSYATLMVADSALGDFKSAYNNYKLYVQYRDSLLSQENTKKTVQAQMQYDFDKKESLAKAEQEKKDLVAAEERRKQRLILWFLVSGFGLVIVVAVFIFRSLRINQKKNRIITLQKEMVERQKHIVEEKQKEILDSIYYARRIQRALITSEKYIERKLNSLNKERG